MSLLDFIFPKRCLGCGRIGKYFCENCRSAIKIIVQNEAICPVCEKPAIDGATHPRCQTRYTLDGLTSFFRYDGIIRQAIKSLKYRYVSDLAQEFTSLIPDSFFNELTKLRTNELTLLPIPLHPSRQRFRGFNQAEVLGRILAKRLAMSVNIEVLKRIRKTTPQVEMKDREKRLQNMKDVFSVNNSSFDIHHSHIVLFDDVFTTGATMRAAANVLKRAGVTSVWAVTMAR